MKSLASKFFAFFVFALLCAAAFPTAALAKPTIKFQVEHVYLYEAGEAEIVGYFENTGDQGAFVKWMDLDLTLIADNGQQMWSDAGIRHYVDDIYVDPAGIRGVHLLRPESGYPRIPREVSFSLPHQYALGKSRRLSSGKLKIRRQRMLLQHQNATEK